MVGQKMRVRRTIFVIVSVMMAALESIQEKIAPETEYRQVFLGSGQASSFQS
jgi:hypothetical protein